MEFLESVWQSILPAVPMSVAIVIIMAVLFTTRFYFEKRQAKRPTKQVGHQLIMLALSFVGILIVIIASPLSDTQQGQLLSLIGILMSAAIALSSTTFIGNIMAGIMLRTVRSFRMGDFIRVGDYFGRVSERGLFHTEIQTEDRDLTTFPNLYLVTNPVKVVRSSGTIISAEVSLGYDVPRRAVETLLLEAAAGAELLEPFVYILELGDFSITYRVSGLLPEVKAVISARSRLRAEMLDKLHERGVEIVSPTFMNTRPLAKDERFIPVVEIEPVETAAEPMPETLAFDKADEAESTEKLGERHTEIESQLKELGEAIKQSGSDSERARLQSEADQLTALKGSLAEAVRRKTEELEGDH